MSFRQFLPYPKTRRKLPKILSQEEVTRLIDASSSLFERTLLMVLYGLRMRSCHRVSGSRLY
jgi:integrase